LGIAIDIISKIAAPTGADMETLQLTQTGVSEINRSEGRRHAQGTVLERILL
jgi:hypothetical protein